MLVKRVRTITLTVLAVGLVVAATTPAATSTDALGAKVSARVLRDTENGRSARFLVQLGSRADVSGARALATKEAKGRFVFETLRAHAARTQAPIRALLDRMGAKYRAFWVANFLAVTGDRAVVDALAARADVASIEPNLKVKSALLPKGKAIPAAGPATPGTVEWNVARIKAPRVWLRGWTGQGITLGNLDTGQQWNHPALQPHYRGWNGSTADHNYNWFDMTDANSPVPVDPNGHGTHTAGTMVGDDGGTNQIGVAPGAQWIGCRVMDAGGLGDPSTYGGCFEWVIAPTDLQGNNPDPSKAPVAISNSWYCSISLGECPNNSILLEVVQNTRAAGIVVVVSAGNSGPSCSTIGIDGPPAQYEESYTVGATTQSDQLASFSSRGPVTFQGTRVKPDIIAPGDFVRSSYPTNTYATLSGTSMASPHIAGTIALIYSRKPQLIGDVDATEALINDTANHINSSLCSSNGSYPNNLYGNGFVNALKATRRGP